MKIGLISRGRTRSTALALILSNLHKISNENENYILAKKVTFIKQFDVFEQTTILQNNLKDITEKLHTKDNFVIKIWPSMLMLPENFFERFKNLDEIKKTILFNIQDCIKLLNYDVLYFLDRDLAYSTISWVYTKKIRKYHKHKKFNIVYSKVKLTPLDYEIATYYILEYCLQQKIKKYLIKENKNFILINDNNYKSYTEPNLLDTEETIVKYDELIENSESFYQFIEIKYNEINSYIDNWIYY